MSFHWVIQLARNDAEALASLRRHTDIQIGEDNEALWLSGKMANESLALALQALPAMARFDSIGGNVLRPVGSRIPSATLPKLSWQPLTSWLQVQAPVAALPGNLPGRETLRLVRSSQEFSANLLRTHLDSWNQFALSAGMIRLAPLRFAVSDSREVLVCGQPIPPLPGRQYVEREGVAVPVGFHWQPAVDISIVRRVFNVVADALIVWDENNTFIRVNAEQFVPATRGNARATAAAMEANV